MRTDRLHLDWRRRCIAALRVVTGALVAAVVGPIRQVVRAGVPAQRRILVIAPLTDGKPGAAVQTQIAR